MKKKIIPLLLIVALIGAGVVLVKKKRSKLAQEIPPQTLAVVVEARQLQAGPVGLTRRTTADVVALHENVVSSRLTAYVTALPLFEGERFKRGDLLVKLDMSLSGSQPQGSSLAADLAAAESALKAEQARLQRTRQLHQIGGVSLELLQAAEAASAAAQARHAVARENLRNASVTAPFDGVVSQRLVQPGDLATPGKPLLKITDTAAGNRLLITLPTGLQPTALKAGGQTLPLQAWPEATPQGLRRFEARATSGFAPGTRVDALAVIYQAPQAVLLPRACLFNSDVHGATVLRLGEQDKLESLNVQLAAEGEEGAASLDPRLASQRVVCASPDILTRLAAGTAFKLQEQKP
ncbi:MAG: HlyD family efflux transporter periplasmic adaptor subunit [Sulfurimicrobium sp.]|jgi:RND family efflux transporter MFP subunit|nr:HlyD family efflux transporter periplasmic adaptor subunit [Sulfurimicrobium sp.]MDZ7654848.1 HlyD family efflux transporter periplasmic adaptor subunit [Sulfurimicrobium sp.]